MYTNLSLFIQMTLSVQTSPALGLGVASGAWLLVGSQADYAS